MTDTFQRFYYDETEDKATIATYQDVAPILNANKRALSETEKGGFKSETFNKMASIPLVVVEKWRTELGVDVFNEDHWPKVVKLLNSPEYKYLRTRPGKI